MSISVDELKNGLKAGTIIKLAPLRKCGNRLVSVVVLASIAKEAKTIDEILSESCGLVRHAVYAALRKAEKRGEVIAFARERDARVYWLKKDPWLLKDTGGSALLSSAEVAEIAERHDITLDDATEFIIGELGLVGMLASKEKATKETAQNNITDVHGEDTGFKKGDKIKRISGQIGTIVDWKIRGSDVFLKVKLQDNPIGYWESIYLYKKPEHASVESLKKEAIE